MNELKVLNNEKTCTGNHSKKKKTCMDNHSVCDAMCCKSISFLFKKLPKGRVTMFEYDTMSDERKNYYNLHDGFKVVQAADRVILVTDPKLPRRWVKTPKGHMLVVGTKCSALDENNMCTIWGTDKHPEICRIGYNIKKDGVVFIPGCIYTPDETSLSLTEKDVEMIKYA